ncbi:MAG: hypothetical protein R2837_06010 [Aliarcobacter sp.]
MKIGEKVVDIVGTGEIKVIVLIFLVQFHFTALYCYVAKHGNRSVTSNLADKL